MDVRTRLILFSTIIITVNNAIMYFVIHNNSINSRIHSKGLVILLFSLIEIVAFTIYSFIHFK